jgi:hypothetical protein
VLDGATLRRAAAANHRAWFRRLARGADRTVRDGTWNGTPLDWAEHLGRPELAAVLRG